MDYQWNKTDYELMIIELDREDISFRFCIFKLFQNKTF